VAREDGLDSIADLQPRHLPLLGHMRTVALQYVWHCQQLQPRQRLVFRLGFHTIPRCAYTPTLGSLCPCISTLLVPVQMDLCLWVRPHE